MKSQLTVQSVLENTRDYIRVVICQEIKKYVKKDGSFRLKEPTVLSKTSTGRALSTERPGKKKKKKTFNT